MTNQVARMGFLPSPIYGRGAGGEGASAHSALSPALGLGILYRDPQGCGEYRKPAGSGRGPTSCLPAVVSHKWEREQSARIGSPL